MWQLTHVKAYTYVTAKTCVTANTYVTTHTLSPHTHPTDDAPLPVCGILRTLWILDNSTHRSPHTHPNDDDTPYLDHLDLGTPT